MAENLNASAIADALEAEYLAVANGQKKPGKIDLEAMVRAVQIIRELERASQPGGGEVLSGYVAVPAEPTEQWCKRLSEKSYGTGYVSDKARLKFCENVIRDVLSTAPQVDAARAALAGREG